MSVQLRGKLSNYQQNSNEREKQCSNKDLIFNKIEIVLLCTKEVIGIGCLGNAKLYLETRNTKNLMTYIMNN